MEDLEKKVKNGNKYELGKLYCEQYKEKFKSLNKSQISTKE